MTALFRAGRLVPQMDIHCNACGMDSKRNGNCTDPSCPDDA